MQKVNKSDLDLNHAIVLLKPRNKAVKCFLRDCLFRNMNRIFDTGSLVMTMFSVISILFDRVIYFIRLVVCNLDLYGFAVALTLLRVLFISLSVLPWFEYLTYFWVHYCIECTLLWVFCHIFSVQLRFECISMFWVSNFVLSQNCVLSMQLHYCIWSVHLHSETNTMFWVCKLFLSTFIMFWVILERQNFTLVPFGNKFVCK